MAIADMLNGTNQDQLSGILAALNQILTPTEKLPQSQSPVSALLAAPQASSTPKLNLSMPEQAQTGNSTLNTLGSYASLAKAAGGLSNLFSPSVASYASSLAAPTAAALSSTVAPELASTGAEIEAGNDAALSSLLSSEGVTPIAGSAPAASAASGGMAGSGGLASSLGALAPVAGIVAAALMSPTVTGISQANINEAGILGNATQAGAISPTAQGAGNANLGVNGIGDVTNTQAMNALNALQELQGEVGVGGPQAQQLLNSLGYKTYAQQVAANGGWVPTPQGGASMGRGVQKS